MLTEVFGGTSFEVEFILGLLFSLVLGVIIGAEREFRGKVAGISTQCFVIAGAMLFTFISFKLDPKNPTTLAGQIITGVGFLGAGIILKSEGGKITNVTTAASIWFSASIGMAIGFKWYLIAIISTIYAILIPRIPSIKSSDKIKANNSRK